MDQQKLTNKTNPKVFWTQINLEELKQKLNDSKRYIFKVIINNKTYPFKSLVDLFEERNCVFHSKCVLKDQTKIDRKVQKISNTDCIKHISTYRKFLVPYQLFYSLNSEPQDLQMANKSQIPVKSTKSNEQVKVSNTFDPNDCKEENVNNERHQDVLIADKLVESKASEVNEHKPKITFGGVEEMKKKNVDKSISEDSFVNKLEEYYTSDSLSSTELKLINNLTSSTAKSIKGIDMIDITSDQNFLHLNNTLSNTGDILNISQNFKDISCVKSEKSISLDQPKDKLDYILYDHYSKEDLLSLLRCKDSRLFDLEAEIKNLRTEIVEQKQLNNDQQTQIEKLKLNCRTMKEKLNHSDKLLKSKDLEFKRLEINLRYKEDSALLERKTKELYYSELCNLEKSDNEECPECSINKLIQFNRNSHNMTINSFNLYKIQNCVGKSMQEEPTKTTSLNEFGKRKTDFDDENSDEEGFSKRVKSVF